MAFCTDKYLVRVLALSVFYLFYWPPFFQVIPIIIGSTTVLPQSTQMSSVLSRMLWDLGNRSILPWMTPPEVVSQTIVASLASKVTKIVSENEHNPGLPLH